MIFANPSRKIGWSSAIRMRVGVSMSILSVMQKCRRKNDYLVIANPIFNIVTLSAVPLLLKRDEVEGCSAFIILRLRPDRKRRGFAQDDSWRLSKRMTTLDKVNITTSRVFTLRLLKSFRLLNDMELIHAPSFPFPVSIRS